MADMDLQIKITASLEQASKAIKSLGASLANLASNVRKAVNSSFNTAGTAIENFGKRLGDLEKPIKKFGRDFTQNITIPIAALAGLSLKKIYDEAYFARGSQVMNAFAAEVQALKKNFDNLLKTLGQELAPIATKVVAVANNLILKFQSLDKETKQIVIYVGLFAAAIGPLLLGLSSVISIVSKVSIAFGGFVKILGAIAGYISAPVVAIVSIITSLAGLINVFLKLREAGVGAWEAIGLALQWFVTGFANLVGGTLLKGISLLLAGLSKVVSLVNNDFSMAISNASNFVQSLSDDIAKEFNAVSNKINEPLQKIGTTAGNAFTFGLYDAVKGIPDKFNSLFNDLTKSTTRAFVPMADEIKAKTEEIATSLSSGIASTMLEIADGTKTAEQAFADFARKTISNLLQMVIQAQLFNAIMGSSFGGGGFGGLAGAATPKKFADGGLVTGPGTGRSDSIMARLSNGEYVMPAAAVKRLGLGFLNGLREVGRNGVPSARSGSIPGFADGGLVTSSASAPQVIIQNSGSPKDVESTSFDPQNAVTTVILQDVQRNGPISKSIQSTFGVKRGGYR